jgi:hypothetical protein
MGYELVSARPDTTSPDLDVRRLAGVPLDVPITERLVWQTYRYGGLLGPREGPLETTSAMAAASLASPVVQLAYVYSARGERTQTERAVEAAARLSPNPGIQSALRALLTTPDSLP